MALFRFTGRSSCVFETGGLTAIFSSHLHRQVSVVEKRCYSAGDDPCTFVITPRPVTW